MAGIRPGYSGNRLRARCPLCQRTRPLTCVRGHLVQEAHHALPLHGGPVFDGGASSDPTVLLLDLWRPAPRDQWPQLTVEEDQTGITLHRTSYYPPSAHCGGGKPGLLPSISSLWRRKVWVITLHQLTVEGQSLGYYPPSAQCGGGP